MNLTKQLAFIVFILFSTYLNAQVQSPSAKRLKIFLDCQNTYCDQTFFRSEINIVDFLMDRLAADVHILITSQRSGGGGNQYQFLFYGQNQLIGLNDTIRFNTGPNDTEFEARNNVIKHFKLGLVPYIIKTGLENSIDINMKLTDTEVASTMKAVENKDPWNYWVFRTGLNGSISGESIYKSSRSSGNFTIERTTEELKFAFRTRASQNKENYEYQNNQGQTEKISVKNSNFSINQSLVKSLSQKWSAGYDAELSNSTFSNNKLRSIFRTGIEYNIYPYKRVNEKFFTLGYGLTFQNNKYYDSTIYDKLSESLVGHFFNANASYTRKWGNLYGGLEYRNFLHDFTLNNLEINFGVNVRVTGGLSFNFNTNYNLVHDQVFLTKGGATEQEILTRRKQLQTNYNYWMSFGINYRFGSKLNNFINPRFENGR